jgi:hypothetical protein
MRGVGRRGRSMAGRLPKGTTLPAGTTFSNSQREAYKQAKIEEYTDDEEVVRLDGGMICPICNLPYRSHDRSKKYNLPGFIQMCNGRTGKF